MANFSGTGVAVITPFDRDQQVDEAALRRVIGHLTGGRVEYLVALGTTGESVTLTPEESGRVLDIFFEEAGQVPVVVGVGGNDTAKVCKQAAEVGKRYPAAGLLSVSPYYNRPSQEGIFLHYMALAGSTDLPIILYNVPGRTASNIEATTVLRLAHEAPGIVAVKEASGNLEQGMAIISGKPEGFQVLSGDDLLGLAQISLGFEGVISVMGNAFPLEYSEMVRLALAGDFAGARDLHYRMRVLMQLNFAEGNPAGVKALMALRGLCEDFVRLPLTGVSASLKERMKKELASM